MKLEDAKPGDVLVDRNSAVWRLTWECAEYWSPPERRWVSMHPSIAEAYAPFHPATARDLECIPVEQRPALRQPAVGDIDLARRAAWTGSEWLPLELSPNREALHLGAARICGPRRVRATDALPGWVLRDPWGVLWIRTMSGLDRATVNDSIKEHISLDAAETLGRLTVEQERSPGAEVLAHLLDEIRGPGAHRICEWRSETLRNTEMPLPRAYDYHVASAMQRSVRARREWDAWARLVAAYREAAAANPAADGTVTHERALTPTELAAKGRKPLAPQDPLGWEVE